MRSLVLYEFFSLLCTQHENLFAKSFTTTTTTNNSHKFLLPRASVAELKSCKDSSNVLIWFLGTYIDIYIQIRAL